MDYIEKPNLPQKPVSLVIVDGRISDEAVTALKAMGISSIKTARYPGLYEAISYHPDIFLHHVCKDIIIYAPHTDSATICQLSKNGFTLLKGATELHKRYPADIAYNVARVGRFYFHNIKYTDNVLRTALQDQGLEPVDVKQGYSKCSIVVIDENTIMTEDPGIAKAAEKKGLEVLFLEHKQNIQLPGLDKGFIGGACGLIDQYSLAFCGDAMKLASYKQIYNFLKKKNINIISLSSTPVMDIGSILPLKTQ